MDGIGRGLFGVWRVPSKRLDFKPVRIRRRLNHDPLVRVGTGLMRQSEAERLRALSSGSRTARVWKVEVEVEGVAAAVLSKAEELFGPDFMIGTSDRPEAVVILCDDAEGAAEMRRLFPLKSH